MKAEDKVLWTSLVFGACVWVAHASLEYAFVYESPWWQVVIAKISTVSLYTRAVLTLSVLAVGLLTSVAFRRTCAAEKLLEKAYGEIEIVLKQRTAELTYSNEQLTRHQTHLESLVRERASELAQSNDKLRIEIAEHGRTEETLRQTYATLCNTLTATVDALSSAAEMRDPYTAGHQRQTTALACAIAREMNIPEDQIEGIHVAGLMHDIGKIAIPAEILSKPGRLNEHEMNLIRIHAQVGHDILERIEFPWPVAKIVLQHHERLNGSGYPQGLKDGEILMGARILAVADTVESMTAHRPFRPALGLEKALVEIRANRGAAYDPMVVDASLRLLTEKGFRLEQAS